MDTIDTKDKKVLYLINNLQNIMYDTNKKKIENKSKSGQGQSGGHKTKKRIIKKRRTSR